MNNLEIYPVTDQRLSEYYGFTQSEVESLAKYYNLEDKLDEMKKWYDGYLFGKTEIYNSWSIVKYIASAIGGNDYSCQAYWINTSSNSIIRQLIEKSDEKTRQKIENLMAGGSVKAVIMCDTALKQIQTNKYAEQLTDDCYEKVINYGIAFYGKTCKVKMGETVYAPED